MKHHAQASVLFGIIVRFHALGLASAIEVHRACDACKSRLCWEIHLTANFRLSLSPSIAHESRLTVNAHPSIYCPRRSNIFGCGSTCRWSSVMPKNQTCRSWKLSLNSCLLDLSDCDYAHHDATDSLGPPAHITCWAYMNGGCKLHDDGCLFSHYDTGIMQ